MISAYLSAFANPVSGYYPIQIVKVRVLNELGAEQYEFRRGQVFYVEVTIKYPGLPVPTYYYYYYYYYYGYYAYYYYYGYAPAPPTISTLTIIRIMDPEQYVFAIGASPRTLSSGETYSFALGWRIPMEARLGDYTIKVMVWDTWIIYGGGNPLALPVEVVIHVVE
ncbi:MAG: hypothetical protein DRZ82_07105 [Thermoprotei archaeon]|nr:MAG: hypothetical protein DRZ82_07105 [Thermoprotei archaeon]